MAHRTPDLAAFQHCSAHEPKAPAFELSSYDPADKPFSSGNKTRDKDKVEQLASELDALQDLFYADRRYKLLVILQGTDTSGKDGTIRGVFGRMSALGVDTIGWKAPSRDEAAHDFLWRIHKSVPACGAVTIFNRSHYEDVLVPVVNGAITPEQTRQRYAHINDFERMLCETGTVILKFYLHISSDTQKRRMEQRLSQPSKNWKYSPGDIATRERWGDYMKAYEDAIEKCSTRWAWRRAHGLHAGD